MNEKELLLALVGKIFNLDATGASSLIYDEGGEKIKNEALTSLTNAQSELVSKLKNSTQKLNDKDKDVIHKAAYKEGRQSLEKEIKEKYNLTSDAIGIGLVDELATTLKADAGSKVVTDDDVKKSKLYQELQTQVAVKDKELTTKLKEETDKIHNEYKAKATLSNVNQKAIDILNSRNPILSKDPNKAKNQMQLLLNEVGNYEYEVDGEKVIVKKDGKLLEDKLGHPVQFDSLITEISDRYYDFAASEEREAAPNPNNVGQGAASNNGQKIKANVTLRKPTSYQDWAKQHAEIDENKLLKPEEKEQLQAELLALQSGGR